MVRAPSYAHVRNCEPNWTTGRPPEDRETANWLADLVLLTTVYEEEDGGHIRLDKYWPCEFRSGGSFGLGPNAAPDGARTVVQFAAKYNLNGTFRVAQGQTVTSLCITPKPFEQCGPIYLPVHRACLEIAARFIHTSQLSQRDTGTSDASFIISVLQLWELLYCRLSGIRDNGDWMLPETHDYLGAGICRGIDWEPENDAEYGALRCPFPPTR